jgi:hypothetical protein
VRTRWAAAAGVLLLTVVLAGCDGDEQADPKPSPSGSTSASSDASPSDPESTTGTPTPTVVPASGETLTLEQFTITMPAGWKVEQESDGGSAIQRGNDHTFGNIIVHSFDRIGIDSLDSFVTAYVKSRNHDGYDLKRLDNRTIDGVEGWVVQGTDPLGDFTYEYGTFSDDQEIHVAFYYNIEYNPSADPFTVIEPVLATLTWT